MLFVFWVPQWIVAVPATSWIFLVCFWAKSPPGGWILYNKLWWLHWVTFILFTLNRTLESGWTKRSSWPTWGLSPAPVQRWPLLSTSVSIHNKTIQLMSHMYLECLSQKSSFPMLQAFLDALQNQAEASSTIIGQFGVGFYSAFMVADRVDVYSRSAEPSAPGYKWSSDGWERGMGCGWEQGKSLFI